LVHDAGGDLHVGRERPKESTGALDRAANARLVFVRSADWLAAGAYVVRMRIHFTTAFVSGAVVFGHWRRDRDLRLDFSAGDYEYAVGRREQNDSFRSVQLNLHGLWERDNEHLPQSAPAAGHELVQPAAFDLELHVRGPSVLVVVDGEPQFRYTTHDGSPIEGSVGLAMNRGAIRVQLPTVQRLDVAEPGQARAAVAAVGLDIGASPKSGSTACCSSARAASRPARSARCCCGCRRRSPTTRRTTSGATCPCSPSC